MGGGVGPMGGGVLFVALTHVCQRFRTDPLAHPPSLAAAMILIYLPPRRPWGFAIQERLATGTAQ